MTTTIPHYPTWRFDNQSYKSWEKSNRKKWWTLTTSLLICSVLCWVHREKIRTSEKLENLNDLLNAVVHVTINKVAYDITAVNTSDAQVKYASDPDRIIHTSNGITHQNLLSSRTIRIRHKEVYVLPPLSYPRIVLNIQPALIISTGVVLAPQALKWTVVEEIVADAASDNIGSNTTLRQVIRTGIDGTTPFPSGTSATSTLSPSGISKTSASPPSGGLWSPRIGNIR